MDLMKRFECPVCGYPELNDPPRSENGGGSYKTCPSSGFEFGVTDEDGGFSYSAWRSRWLETGMRWTGMGGEPVPIDWHPEEQVGRVSRLE
jgi:hypothetical protein